MVGCVVVDLAFNSSVIFLVVYLIGWLVVCLAVCLVGWSLDWLFIWLLKVILPNITLRPDYKVHCNCVTISSIENKIFTRNRCFEATLFSLSLFLPSVSLPLLIKHFTNRWYCLIEGKVVNPVYVMRSLLFIVVLYVSQLYIQWNILIHAFETQQKQRIRFDVENDLSNINQYILYKITSPNQTRKNHLKHWYKMEYGSHLSLKISLS